MNQSNLVKDKEDSLGVGQMWLCILPLPLRSLLLGVSALVLDALIFSLVKWEL